MFVTLTLCKVAPSLLVRARLHHSLRTALRARVKLDPSAITVTAQRGIVHLQRDPAALQTPTDWVRVAVRAFCHGCKDEVAGLLFYCLEFCAHTFPLLPAEVGSHGCAIDGHTHPDPSMCS